MTLHLPPALDVSALLKPGVYILLRHGHPTYVGTSKCLLLSLGQHLIRNRSPLPSWFPIAAIPFDGVQAIPCDTARAAALAPALIDFHRPWHNRTPRGHAQAEPGANPPPHSAPAPVPYPARRL